MSNSVLARIAGASVRIALPLRVLTILLVGVLAIGWSPAGQARGAPDSFADLAEKLLPAVVNISTTQVVDPSRAPQMPQSPPGSPFEDFFDDFFNNQRPGPRRATSLGSGFIIDKSGLVVTNNHVIDGATEITVILHDDTSLKAKLIGKDAKTDLALLKVESRKPLPAVSWGDSDKLRVGDWVLAIGNPFGLGGTVTAGIVSQRSRDINAGPYDEFIQTDAAINRGNSGGPLFNMDGQVVGINSVIISPSGGSIGIGFAIPASLAQPVIGQLEKYGQTRRGWLGVRIQNITPDMADSLGLASADGALVAGVSDGGPADKSGIQPGDVILNFAGKPVANSRRLPRIVADTQIGQKVPVDVIRKGKKQTVQVIVGELPEDEPKVTQTSAVTPPPAKADAISSLGIAVADLTAELRSKLDLNSQAKGVVIIEVAANSPAFDRGLRPGDIIVEVSQQEVASVKDVTARINEARQAGKKSVLLLVNHRGERRFVSIEFDRG